MMMLNLNLQPQNLNLNLNLYLRLPRSSAPPGEHLSLAYLRAQDPASAHWHRVSGGEQTRTHIHLDEEGHWEEVIGRYYYK